jgi:hypothetical protein
MKSLAQLMTAALLVIFLIACKSSADKPIAVKTPLKPTLEATIDNYLETNISSD